jgi:hypothetical protein
MGSDSILDHTSNSTDLVFAHAMPSLTTGKTMWKESLAERTWRISYGVGKALRLSSWIRSLNNPLLWFGRFLI